MIDIHFCRGFLLTEDSVASRFDAVLLFFLFLQQKEDSILGCFKMQGFWFCFLKHICPHGYRDKCRGAGLRVSKERRLIVHDTNSDDGLHATPF